MPRERVCMSVADVTREHQVSELIASTRRQKFGSMDHTEVGRLRPHEVENGKL